MTSTVDRRVAQLLDDAPPLTPRQIRALVPVVVAARRALRKPRQTPASRRAA